MSVIKQRYIFDRGRTSMNFVCMTPLSDGREMDDQVSSSIERKKEGRQRGSNTRLSCTAASQGKKLQNPG
jgi:hypothetical protein